MTLRARLCVTEGKAPLMRAMTFHACQWVDDRKAGQLKSFKRAKFRARLFLIALTVLAQVAAVQTVAAEVVVAKGGVVRVLDRMSETVTDYDLAPGQSQAEGKLSVRLDECRYPADQPMGEAFAHLTITDSDQIDPLFKGWMVASSPALNALDHPRYDVWVLHCDVPADAQTPPVDSTNSGSGSGG